MKVSVIIPAYDEEKYLPQTLEALQTVLRSIGDQEIIVVDNASTDATHEIAAGFVGVKIVNEPKRNIGAVRNTGARESTGEAMVFLDADTLVRPGVFENIIDTLADTRYLGGSVAVEYERPDRAWVRLFTGIWDFLGRLTKIRQGALQFCRRDV